MFTWCRIGGGVSLVKNATAMWICGRRKRGYLPLRCHRKQQYRLVSAAPDYIWGGLWWNIHAPGHCVRPGRCCGVLRQVPDMHARLLLAAAPPTTLKQRALGDNDGNWDFVLHILLMATSAWVLNFAPKFWPTGFFFNIYLFLFFFFCICTFIHSFDTHTQTERNLCIAFWYILSLIFHYLLRLPLLFFYLNIPNNSFDAALGAKKRFEHRDL